MAFKDISAANSVSRYIKATEMEVGSSITGQIQAIRPSKNIEGQFTIYMTLDSGENVGFNPAGNIKYLLQDGKIKEGYLTRITRLNDKKVKSKVSTQFRVEQDTDAPSELSELVTTTVATARPTKAEAKRDGLAAKAKLLEEAE